MQATPNRPTFVTLPSIALDQTSALPLYRQLYNALREAILTGQLKAGARLPATRALANAFGISRNTVMNAYAQLLAEAYLALKDESQAKRLAVSAGEFVRREGTKERMISETMAVYESLLL